MISVPRDLGVAIDGRGQRKINNANSFGEANEPGSGGEYARQIFAKTFNLDIPYYIRVDFKAFEEIINTVGGLTIDVKKAFVDNLYPGPNYSYAPISFEAGAQNMNGERALQYVRSAWYQWRKFRFCPFQKTTAGTHRPQKQASVAGHLH